MKWIRERDALIAQTLAFVQSVTGRKDGLGLTDGRPAVPVARFEAVPYVAGEGIAEAETPEVSPAPQLAPPRIAGDFRSEIQNRVASFRKHQERFEREREEYCASTLARLRTEIGSPPARK